MDDITKLQVYLAEVVKLRPVSDAAREVVWSLIHLPGVRARFPSLSTGEMEDVAAAYLDRVHESAGRLSRNSS